ncbi:hypothetical protein [Chitinasiproducens palmae]|uniref:hypothetical protein n=1 Tax=Chitinasiproducens palmae TaxID=1770053 RepID=UPI0011146B9A|nr:hypothetical protein [Chitinasiproducens palmae]
MTIDDARRMGASSKMRIIKVYLHARKVFVMCGKTCAGAVPCGVAERAFGVAAVRRTRGAR